jgi:hypothetical protein
MESFISLMIVFSKEKLPHLWESLRLVKWTGYLMINSGLQVIPFEKQTSTRD